MKRVIAWCDEQEGERRGQNKTQCACVGACIRVGGVGDGPGILARQSHSKKTGGGRRWPGGTSCAGPALCGKPVPGMAGPGRWGVLAEGAGVRDEVAVLRLVGPLPHLWVSGLPPPPTLTAARQAPKPTTQHNPRMQADDHQLPCNGRHIPRGRGVGVVLGVEWVRPENRHCRAVALPYPIAIAPQVVFPQKKSDPGKCPNA